MSRRPCFRPRTCGVSFHVAGTASEVACREAVKSLPRRSGPKLDLPPEPVTSKPLIEDADGNLIMKSGLIPPVPGCTAIIRDRQTGNLLELEFQEGTRRINDTSVYRWKFYRKDKPGELRFMLWDASNPEISPYEVVEYV